MIGQVQIPLIVKQQQHRRRLLSLLYQHQQPKQELILSTRQRKSQLLQVPVVQQVTQLQSVTAVNSTSTRYYSSSSNYNKSTSDHNFALNNNNNNSSTTIPTPPFGSNNVSNATANAVAVAGSSTVKDDTTTSGKQSSNNTNTIHFIPIQHSSKKKVTNTKICINTNDLKTITKYILGSEIGTLYTFHNNINIVPVKKIPSKIIQQFVATNDRYLAWTNTTIYTIIQLTEYILRGFAARIQSTIWNRTLHNSNSSNNTQSKVDIVTDTDNIITTIGIMIQLVQRLEQEGAHYMIQRNNFYEQIYGISPIRPESTSTNSTGSNKHNTKEQQDPLLLAASSSTSSSTTVNESMSSRTNHGMKPIAPPVDPTTSMKELETFILSLKENNFLGKNNINNSNKDFNLFDDLYGTLRNRTDPFLTTTASISTSSSSPDIAFNELLIELRHDKKQQQQTSTSATSTEGESEESTTTTKNEADIVDHHTNWLQEQLKDIQNSTELKRQHVLDTIQYKMKQLQYSIIQSGSSSSGTSTSNDSSTTSSNNNNEEDDIQYIDPTLFQSTYVSDFAVPGPTVSMYDIILDTIACSADCIAKNTRTTQKNNEPVKDETDNDTTTTNDPFYLLTKAQYIQKKVLQRYSHDINKFDYTALTNTDKLNNTIYHYICPTIATFNTVVRTASNHAIGLYDTNIDANGTNTNTNITNEQQMILRDTCLDVLLSSYIVLIEASEPCTDSTKLFCSVLHPDIANSTSASNALQLTDTNINDDDDSYISDNEEEYKEENDNNDEEEEDDDEDTDDEEEYIGIDNEYTTGGSIDTGIVRINTASYLYLLHGFNNIIPSSYIKSNIIHGLYKQAKDQRVLSNLFINEYKSIATKLQVQNYVLPNSNTEQTLRILNGHRDPNIPNIPNHHWNDKISTTSTTTNSSNTTTIPYQSLVKYKQNSKRLQYTSKDPTY